MSACLLSQFLHGFPGAAFQPSAASQFQNEFFVVSGDGEILVGYFDGKGQIFVIPVDFEPKTPEVPCVDNGVCDKKPLGAEPPPREEASYSLAASRDGLGELTPILLGNESLGDDNIIDGFHRNGETPNWTAIRVPHIDTPIKLEM